MAVVVHACQAQLNNVGTRDNMRSCVCRLAGAGTLVQGPLAPLLHSRPMCACPNPDTRTTRCTGTCSSGTLSRNAPAVAGSMASPVATSKPTTLPRSCSSCRTGGRRGVRQDMVSSQSFAWLTQDLPRQCTLAAPLVLLLGEGGQAPGTVQLCRFSVLRPVPVGFVRESG